MKRAAWIAIAVAAWLPCRGPKRACELALVWHAPAAHYDYFQSIELRRDGTGELAMGEGQMVRSEVTIRYRVTRDAIALRYVTGTQAAPRVIEFVLDEGDFVVIEPDYDGRRERHFRCRLRFTANPFPPDVYSDDHLDYYACER